MAYVGTAQDSGDPITTLASVIEGEAGNQGPQGMQAVGNVIANRAAQNFGKYGSDLVSQATARNQFQGQAKPSTAALLTAAKLLSGGLDDITGGATSYANPAASSAPWAKNLNENNALKIGDHYFTDNQDGNPFLGKSVGNDNQSTFDKVTSAVAAKLPTDTMTDLLNAYQTNQLSPDAKAQFEQFVNQGKIVLPTGVKIGGQATAPKETAVTVPQSMVDAYNNEQLSPEAKQQLNDFVQQGKIKLPSGAVLLQSTKPEYSGAILPITRYSDGRWAFDSNAGLVGAVKNAVTLPGDVATGKVDPNSQEAIQRSFDLAGLVSGHAPEPPVLPAAAKAGVTVDRGLAEGALPIGSQPFGDVPIAPGEATAVAPPPVAATAPEKVQSAALKIDGQILTGSSHFNIIDDLHKQGVTNDKIYNENPDGGGFVTNTGRYIDRKEALNLADNQNQLKNTKDDIQKNPKRLGVNVISEDFRPGQLTSTAPPVARVMTAADVAKDAAQGDAAIAGAEKTGTLPDGSKPPTAAPLEPPSTTLGAAAPATGAAQEGVAATLGEASRDTKTGAKVAADIVQANPEIVQAANDLGIGHHMEPAFVSDNQAFREIDQGMKSIPGSAGKASQVENINAIADKAHNVAQSLEGTQDISQLSDATRSQMAQTHADLLAKENQAYQQVRDALPPKTPAAAPEVISFIQQRAADLGGEQHLTKMEQTILHRLEPAEAASAVSMPEAPTPDPNTGRISAQQFREYLQARDTAQQSVGTTEAKAPTYALLDDTRKLIGRGLKNEGLFKDEDIGLKKQLYARITADQGKIAEANGVGDAWNAAKKITIGRKILERQVTALFGRQLEKETFTGNMQAKLQTATNALAKGDASQFAKFIASVPSEMRQRVAATALYSTLTKGMRNGRINFGNFSKWYENLANNKQSYNAIMSNLPTGAPKQIHDLYLVAKGIQRAGESAITNGRIVALGPQFQGADTLMTRLYGAAQGAAAHAGKHAAAELIGHTVGIPGAGVLTAVGSALFQGAKPDAIKAVDTLLASPEFRQAVMTNASGDTKQASAVLATSKPFSKFVKSVGKNAQLTNRQRWIAQALTSNNSNSQDN